MALIIQILFLFCSPAHADIVLTGRYLPAYEIVRKKTRVEVSHSQIGQLKIQDSQLSGVTGYKAEIPRLIWERTEAKAVDFSLAQLMGSAWSFSNLLGVRFRGADLRGAVFNQVQIIDCAFDSTDLRGTVFTGSALFNCSFWQARFNDATVMPFDSATALTLGMIYVP